MFKRHRIPIQDPDPQHCGGTGYKAHKQKSFNNVHSWVARLQVGKYLIGGRGREAEMRERGTAVSGLKKKRAKPLLKHSRIIKWRKAKERITNSSGQVVSFQHFHILKMRN
jgi:hypothetical protein